MLTHNRVRSLEVPLQQMIPTAAHGADLHPTCVKSARGTIPNREDASGYDLAGRVRDSDSHEWSTLDVPRVYDSWLGKAN